MAADSAHRVLRIGVIQGGKIVEERVLPARQPVTVGSARGNAIVVSKSQLPPSTLVFSWQGDRWALHFAPGTEGRARASP